MKNPACTVCHERLDPMAGTFQNFGDDGKFRQKGTHSLADTYTNPEWFGGSPSDTPYRLGDTWYRDMRAPGLEKKKAPNNNNSLQWLAKQITKDPRFAKATVAFWWPAIMGAEPIEQPTEPSDPGYQQQLNAYNAQQALMDDLAKKFRNRGFKAKQLFADMVLSDWFRAEGFEVQEGENRDVELATIGSGRLLTPEELDRKNFALFGARWNEDNVAGWNYKNWRPLYDKGSEMYLAYGGIDSNAILERSRELTPLMTNVAEKMAIEYSCRVPTWDFNPAEMTKMRNHCSQDEWWDGWPNETQCQLLPPEARSPIFTHVTKQTVPNAGNKRKIEDQIVALYDYMYGVTVKRNDPGVQVLYELLETRRREYQQNGWIDRPCWIGNEQFGELIWDSQKYDPEGMAGAWASVIRAMMTNYLYLHE
ncbi:MAG: hypothetical protein V2I82_17575, partial [Halieaceae bacterium]|jgi:hypothetical protein|nr:hypothetical protein [Halieaceae bacterium]